MEQLRGTLDQLQGTLDQLILQSFHIVPINTQRHDQWYKRQYQGKWKDGRLPLILTPKESRDEWTPQVHQFAVKFAKAVRGAISDESSKIRQEALLAETVSSDSKLFQDTVLDEFQTTFKPCSVEEKTLTPAMQRLVFWTVPHGPGQVDLQSWADAVRALLACEQIGPLLYLARRPEVPLRELAPKKTKYWTRGQFKSNIIGWELALVETLEFLFFVQILKSFPDALGKQECERWVPYAFAGEASPIRRYLQTHRGTESSARIAADIKEQIQRCFRIVCLERMLADVCGLPALNLEEYVITAFLSFLGFESWNREREGEGYLGCDLNTTKDEKWLWQNMGNDEKQAAKEERDHDSQSPFGTRPKSPRPRDPLLLREPKAKPIEELDDEAVTELNKLSAMEDEEAAYGRKRSTKYHRKQ